jgi:hypothetical protein
MRMSPAIFDYSGVPIDGDALSARVVSADPTRQGWPPTLTCCQLLLLDLRFLHIQRAGEACRRTPLRSCWAGRFVYRLTAVAAAEAEPVPALLRRFLAFAK